MPEAYSPFRYPGGKSKLSSFLIKVIQESPGDIDHYVEPYAGGAGSALRLLFEEYVSEITINDADPRVYCFWKAITESAEQFAEDLREIPVSVEEWKRQRAIYLKRDLRKKYELGFATFYLNRTSRSGIIHNGGPIGGLDQSGNYKIDARYNADTLARRILRIGAYSDQINVSCTDGLELLKSINRKRSKAPNYFVYLDPPYYKKGSSLYMNCFNHEQHRQLAQLLARGPIFSWVLTYDNVEEIRELYDGFSTLPFELNYSTATYRRGSELLIYPKDVHLSPEVFQELPLMPMAS